MSSVFPIYLRVCVCSERRPYMRAAYAMFLGESKEDELAMQMTKSAINDDAKSATAYFYANLYLGLYSEAKGDDALAQKCEARSTRYRRHVWEKSSGVGGEIRLADLFYARVYRCLEERGGIVDSPTGTDKNVPRD